ncbi:hypothetical protein AKO1_014071 [Acrasis kona]|uniref:Uncharacterized protein n=1 Tax=Acrasis kona TaxID=1008807 RepID=A0AAW2YVE4_9EUKA
MINIDQTAPVIVLETTEPANTNGWWNQDVTVVATCSDDLSGVSVCNVQNTNKNTFTQTQEGSNQVVTAVVVDDAGNSVYAQQAVNLDKTDPTIASSLSSQPNANGWFNESVVVHFDCNDELSGVESCTPDVVVSSQGTEMVVTGVAVDRAGNSQETTSQPISIDNEAPILTGTPRTKPNANGWYNRNVTVDFSCSDALSGVVSCPLPVYLNAEGKDISVEKTLYDYAGNSAQSNLLISIDRTAPVIISQYLTTANEQGWFNQIVVVNYTCTDALSGVESCSAPVAITQNGQSVTVVGQAIDLAGNLATVEDVIKVDTVPPVVAVTTSSNPNAQGWFNHPVTVHFECSDAVSGVVRCPKDIYLQTKGIHNIRRNVTDNAGNVFVVDYEVKIDLYAPVTQGKLVPAENQNGWINQNAKVVLNATDDLSGVLTTHYIVDQKEVQVYTAPYFVTGEGIHTTSFSSVDNANNVESYKSLIVRIDTVKPTITSQINTKPNENGWYNTPITITYQCDDGCLGSGIAYCPPPLTVDQQGLWNITANATDLADNSQDVTNQDINIDLLPPNTTVVRDVYPNANGWNNQNVTITLVSFDQYSGVYQVHYEINAEISNIVTINNQTGNVTLPFSNEGVDLIRYYATDRASNVEGAQFAIVRIDKTAPFIHADKDSLPNQYNWYNHDVRVSFTCGDSLSGIDGSCPSTVIVAGQQANQYANATVYDLAGNSASDGIYGLNIDKVIPQVNITRSPLANADGWNNEPVTVSITCTDDLSGVLSCPPTVVVSGEGANQFVNGTAVDYAGNENDILVSNINIDYTAPVITATRNPVANRFGWVNKDVKVTFSCSDNQGGSGLNLGACPQPVVLTQEGADQSAEGTVYDRARNTASTVLSGVNIDKTAPVLNINLDDNSTFPVCDFLSFRPTFNPTDSLSGLLSQSSLVGLPPTGDRGTFTFTARALDKAGNLASETRSFFVHYMSAFHGFHSPRRNSTYTIGSQIPIKFALFCGDFFTGIVPNNVIARVMITQNFNPSHTYSYNSGAQFVNQDKFFSYDLDTSVRFSNPDGDVVNFVAGEWTIVAVLNDGTYRTRSVTLVDPETVSIN